MTERLSIRERDVLRAVAEQGKIGVHVLHEQFSERMGEDELRVVLCLLADRGLVSWGRAVSATKNGRKEAERG